MPGWQNLPMQRTAVVTGASIGIGAATAVKLAEAGYHVVLAARRADHLEAVAARIREAGGQATIQQLDVTDRAAIDSFADALERCDVLVSNAGGAIGMDAVADSAPDDWLAMYEVNVLGTLHVTQALLPKLVASGAGTIVVMDPPPGSSPMRAAVATWRPSTRSMDSPGPCASSCWASPSA